jgi:putative FmdB family regulatory protein
MPRYSYFCKACDDPYDVRLSIEEKESFVPRCPNCGGGEEQQELYAVFGDGGSAGGCCGGGCCG